MRACENLGFLWTYFLTKVEMGMESSIFFRVTAFYLKRRVFLAQFMNKYKQILQTHNKSQLFLHCPLLRVK